MIGLVVATHGNLGAVMLETVAMIIGPLDHARAITVSRQTPPEQLQEQLARAIAEVGVGEGVLVAADMFGGTPANVGMALLDTGCVEVLTGVNLPMLIKFFAYRERLSLPELAEQLKNHARDGIVLASAALSRQS